MSYSDPRLSTNGSGFAAAYALQSQHRDSIKVKRRASAFRSVLTWVACIFFLSMLFLPTLYVGAKAIVLVSLTLCTLSCIYAKGGLIDSEVLLVCFAMIGTGMLGVAIGATNSTPGWIPCSRVSVLWPSLFLLFTFVVDYSLCRSLVRTISWGGVLVGLYLILFALETIHLIPPGLIPAIQEDQLCARYGKLFECNLTNISSLPFILPFLLAAYLHCHRATSSDTLGRSQLRLSLLIAGIASLLTGRRGLWLSILLSVPIAQCLRLLIGRSRISHVVYSGVALVTGCCIGVLLLDHYTEFGLDLVFEKFLTSFDVTGDDSNSIRAWQFRGLIDHWWDAPVFGAGLGAACPGVVRDEAMPWAFELTYIAVLYQNGIVGLLAYAMGITWIVVRGIEVARHDSACRPLIVPLLVGLISFLAANATNPYLAKFDYMWVIFLPVWVINVSRTRRFHKQSLRI